MDEGKKKMIMIVVIVACIAAAVIITVATHSGSSAGGIESIKRGSAQVWLRCNNPECKHEWQMDKRDYAEYMRANRDRARVPRVVCPKCGMESGEIFVKKEDVKSEG